MIKKIVMYNFFTFFFSLAHLIYSILFFKKYFPLILKIYVFLLPVNNLFFLFYLFTKKKYKYSTYIYVLCSMLKLFFSIYVFFYSIINYYSILDFSLLLKALIHFIFSYFMILFFIIIFLLN